MPLEEFDCCLGNDCVDERTRVSFADELQNDTDSLRLAFE